ncbi:MAG: class I SAM-dependent rRNA methyltransferase [Candidatus Aminicenantes bacterium]|nr:class I SAM-dependent rRNA methyltransferase [Candidatus Aminicenantes bacterium]
MDESAVILHPGKDKAVRNRHPWIFSGAVRRMPPLEPGEIRPVLSADGDFLGTAYFNPKTSIVGRMLAFDRTPPLDALRSSLRRAVAMRKTFFESPDTTAFRLVNGEGDDCPGLIVDRYADRLVLQISTLGMDLLRDVVLDELTDLLTPRSIYEKSNLPSRREEGIPPREGLLRGEPLQPFEILEDGLRFLVDIPAAQKTGFYLDQREMRRLARRLAAGRRVLNAFSYTGAFTVAALAGGAIAADSVDVSAKAVAAARENCLRNGYEGGHLGFHEADVFEFLRQRPLDYDLVVLDPPAFAKRKSEVMAACRGYKDIHRLVFEKVPEGTLVLTFSCSFHVDETLFGQVVFQAAREADRRVRILQRHHQAFDHPVSVYHPESDYLKGLVLHVG